MKYANDNTGVNLHGQADGRRTEDTGYAMAVLLVGIAVISILLSAAMPVWRQVVRREQEAELVFRGEQYARAIGLFQRKYAGAFPPSLDVLVEQKYLRRKYKDPFTKDGEFQILYQTTPQTPGTASQPGGGPGQSGPTTGRGAGGAPGSSQSTPAGTRSAVGPQGGIVGVVSKNKEQSIRLYKGRQHYNEWQFVYVQVMTQPGGAPGSPRPGTKPGEPGGPTPTGQPRPGLPGRPGEPVGPGPGGSGSAKQPGRRPLP